MRFLFHVSILMSSCVALALAGCTKPQGSGEAAQTTHSDAKRTRVGLVLDKGGKDDKSFNGAAYEGAKKAEKELGIELKTVETSDDSAIEPALRTFAQRGYDLVIAIGFVMEAAIQKVAKEFPQVHFAVIDSKAPAPNIRSILFKEHEGSFLVGAIAALVSKTHQIGFIGGMDIPLIRRFELGYRAGAKSVDPKVKITTNYIGSTSEAWKNPMKAKELALSQYRAGVDVIFGPCGASTAGLFDAAEETKKFAIGTDSNQNWIKPGRILTSMVKRVDQGVFETIDLTRQGKFESGEFSLGLKEEGVGYALDQYNRALLTPETLKKVDSLKKEIISGQLQVPDFYITKTIPKS